MDELTVRSAREAPFRASVTGGDPERYVVVVSGEVDLATGPRLAELLTSVVDTAGPGVEVVADLAAVDFFGAAGIKALVGPAERARSRGGVLRVDPISPVVARVLDLAGCRDRLACPPSPARLAPVTRISVAAPPVPLTAPGAGSPDRSG
ncbi:MAG TPA: STAS domain-containing protein [Pseudonocardia sp.]|nr:STAS domain-containing protein [Pseudonocardia sp.]